jgi:hypothetical protein
MDNNFRQAIMHSAESFIMEYDPNENRRIDKFTASTLVKKLTILNKKKECPICFDTAHNNQISKLPCCNNEICQPCIINTITQNTKDCPMCRKDLVEIITKLPTQQSTPSQYTTDTDLFTTPTSSTTEQLSTIYTLKKYTTVRSKNPETGEPISTQSYNLMSNGVVDKRSGIEMIYHNNTEPNRRLFESFLLDYIQKKNNSLIIDELNVWKNIRHNCKNFTEQYKYKPRFIPNDIIHKFYDKLGSYFNSMQIR